MEFYIKSDNKTTEFIGDGLIIDTEKIWKTLSQIWFTAAAL